jgi:hypothetical protein
VSGQLEMQWSHLISLQLSDQKNVEVNMHTLSKKEQSKWVNIEGKKEINRVREAVNFTAVFVFVSAFVIAFCELSGGFSG